MNPDEKMARARAELVMDHPFFGSLALRMRLAPDPDCAGMWTDGRTLGYRPALVEALPLNTAVGLLAHEMLHVVCAHHLRRQGRDETLWNRACDYAVNAILDEAGVRRALIETVAENFNDGVVAPLFYLTLGGPVLAVAYKAVNTLDSMVGYRDQR
ncbi:MAG: DUF2201 family putative metallopeptidase, partial [Thermodesulfobacteriota bacterium]